jgi:hypothetical protein
MNSQQIWKVQVQDRVYEAHKDELIEWIQEGAVLPNDKVQRGNLNWLAASRVPEFARFFSKPREFENSAVTVEITHANGSAISAQLESASDKAQVGETDTTGSNSDQSEALDLNADSLKHCAFHPSRPTAFICDICRVTYCNLCPNRYGAVRLCPSCGGLCTTYENLLAGSRPQGAMNRPYARRDIESDDAAQDKFGIGISEVIAALKFPFRSPKQLAVSAVLYVVAALGISSALTGVLMGLILGAASLGFAIMISFAVSARVFNDKGDDGFQSLLFSEGLSGLLERIGLSFTVVFASFCLFICLAASAGAYAWIQFSHEIEMTQSAVSNERNRIETKLKNARLDSNPASELRAKQEALAESALFYGSDEIDRFTGSVMRLSIYFLTPVFVAFLLGLVYLPAALSLALRNRSIRQTLSLVSGLRQIRMLGFEYVKIVFLSITLTLIFVAACVGLSILLSDRVPSPVLFFSTVTLAGISSCLFWIVFSHLITTADSQYKLRSERGTANSNEAEARTK